MKRMLQPLLTAAAVLIALPALAETETFTVSFVQTNDIDRMAADDDRGGFAKLAAVAKDERSKGTVIFVHSGDTLSPSLLSGIDRGVHIIDILNHLDLDAMVPGNHEFDFGPAVFRQRMGEATFDIVSSNIREADGSAPASTIDEKIVEINGVKFGFYGLTTESTPVVSSPGDITFTDSVDTGVAKAKSLHDQGADIVVAIVHTPVDVDFALTRANAADIILSGHDEFLMTYFDGRHTLTESGAQGESVVITDVTVTREVADDGKVSVDWEPAFRIIDTKSVEPDADIAALVQGYEDKLDAELGVAVGTTETPLDSRRSSVRSEETAIGNLITDAMRGAVEADFAITNGGGIRGDTEYDAGTQLTRKDILSELPFGNKTVKLELTGAQIRAALENGFSQVENGGGRFPQISGFKVAVDFDHAAGQRVLDVTVGDEPLDAGRTYTVATNDFMASGGDGDAVFIGAKNLLDAVDSPDAATSRSATARG
jgi:2',3'-cyclic-nucleotide 2'-phosphodiesterase (5'-nucleotidase family)